jgi:hypothetical protein
VVKGAKLDPVEVVHVGLMIPMDKHLFKYLLNCARKPTGSIPLLVGESESIHAHISDLREHRQDTHPDNLKHETDQERIYRKRQLDAELPFFAMDSIRREGRYK